MSGSTYQIEHRLNQNLLMKAFVPLSHDLRRSIGHFVLNIRFFVVNFSLEFAPEVETSYGFILNVSFYEKCHQIPYKLAPPTGHWVGNLQNLFTDQLRRFQTSTLKIYFQQSILYSTKHFVDYTSTYRRCCLTSDGQEVKSKH